MAPAPIRSSQNAQATGGSRVAGQPNAVVRFGNRAVQAIKTKLGSLSLGQASRPIVPYSQASRTPLAGRTVKAVDISTPLLTPSVIKARLSGLAGQAIAPDVARSLQGKINFDGLGRVKAEQSGKFTATGKEMDDIVAELTAAVVKSPTETNSSGVREARSEREVVMEFMRALDEAPAHPASSAAVADLKASMKALWLGGGLNSASAAAALDAAAAKLDKVEPKLADTARRLGTEAATPKLMRQYHDNMLGRRFESELVQALVKNPPAPALAAAKQVGAFVFMETMRSCAHPTDPSRYEMKQLQDVFHTIAHQISHDPRPWFAETPEISAFVDAVHNGDSHADCLSLFSQMMSKTTTGFDVMKQSFLGVKITLSMNAPWRADANGNYSNVVVPARSTVTAVGGSVFSDATIAQTRGFGTVLPHQAGIRPDVGTPERWGQGRSVQATVQPDFDNSRAFEKKTLGSNQNNVNGASGSTNIMTHLYQNMQAKGEAISVDDAFLGTMMFLTFDGGHSIPESVGTYASIMSTAPTKGGDDVGNRKIYDQRKTALATNTTSYAELDQRFSNSETRKAVREAVDASFDRVGAFFDAIHAERTAS